LDELLENGDRLDFAQSLGQPRPQQQEQLQHRDRNHEHQQEAQKDHHGAVELVSDSLKALIHVHPWHSFADPLDGRRWERRIDASDVQPRQRSSQRNGVVPEASLSTRASASRTAAPF
jgi:hypothetical protein